jgi:diketogulonate reductase-like aldo/keto reductase
MAKIFTPIPHLKLNDGNSIPMLGYGTGTAWYKAAGNTKVDRDLVESTKTAIKLGYYYLDGAECKKSFSILNTERGAWRGLPTKQSTGL